ncbi:MAG: hypothetical protein H7338_24310 [Candidatus Sericytochromatia bacterium]|nr:hypothetical protein [Candidatus Sericytochromatia bacterium]
MQTPFLRMAAMPFAVPDDLRPPAEPILPSGSPFVIDPALSAADQQTLRQISEGLRLSLTGRRLYAFVESTFAARLDLQRQVQLTLAPLGKEGNRAITSGRPPTYLVTLNRELVGPFGWQAMVPKLAHELVHIRDYDGGATRAVAIEVSGHAADAAVAYESNMATNGRPTGPFSALTSLRAVYERHYVAFRQRPSRALYQTYWRELFTLVAYARTYRNIYLDASGETIWNSPAGAPTDATYVPYDPSFRFQ